MNLDESKGKSKKKNHEMMSIHILNFVTTTCPYLTSGPTWHREREREMHFFPLRLDRFPPSFQLPQTPSHSGGSPRKFEIAAENPPKNETDSKKKNPPNRHSSPRIDRPRRCQPPTPPPRWRRRRPAAGARTAAGRGCCCCSRRRPPSRSAPTTTSSSAPGPALPPARPPSAAAPRRVPRPQGGGAAAARPPQPRPGHGPLPQLHQARLRERTRLLYLTPPRRCSSPPPRRNPRATRARLVLSSPSLCFCFFPLFSDGEFEQKINQKNTWELGLIDHLSEIIQAGEEDDDETNFQKVRLC